MPLFYMSFCDTKKPKGQQFLGATVAEGADAKAAFARATYLGNNPGGEVAIVELEGVTMDSVPETGRKYLNRFVPRDVVMGEIGDADQPFDAIVCQGCNPVEAA